MPTVQPIGARGDWWVAEDPEQEVRWQTVADLIRRFTCKSVLDVGCGLATLADYLLPTISYTGLDPEAETLSRAREHCSAGILVQGTIETFDPQQQWDCLILNEVLYYMRKPAAVLQKCASLLNPGGVLIISIYDRPLPLRTRARKWLRGENWNRRALRTVRSAIRQFGWRVLVDQKVCAVNRPDPWVILAVRP